MATSHLVTCETVGGPGRFRPLAFQNFRQKSAKDFIIIYDQDTHGSLYESILGYEQRRCLTENCIWTKTVFLILSDIERKKQRTGVARLRRKRYFASVLLEKGLDFEAGEHAV